MFVDKEEKDIYRYDGDGKAKVVTGQGAKPTFHEVKPDAYSSWQQKYRSEHDDKVKSLEETLSEIEGESFTYDPMSDELYQMYQKQYMENGQLAMKDTMANAAILSGGYGNSYAQTVGQQVYNQHMSELDSMIPELYEAAYGRWRDERADKVEAYERDVAEFDEWNTKALKEGYALLDAIKGETGGPLTAGNGNTEGEDAISPMPQLTPAQQKAVSGLYEGISKNSDLNNALYLGSALRGNEAFADMSDEDIDAVIKNLQEEAPIEMDGTPWGTDQAKEALDIWLTPTLSDKEAEDALNAYLDELAEGKYNTEGLYEYIVGRGAREQARANDPVQSQTDPIEKIIGREYTRALDEEGNVIDGWNWWGGIDRDDKWVYYAEDDVKKKNPITVSEAEILRQLKDAGWSGKKAREWIKKNLTNNEDKKAKEEG